VKFANATEIDQLHRKAADLARHGEHVGLNRHGAIPAWLTAHRRVDREHKPAFCLRQCGHARGGAQEGINLPRTGTRRQTRLRGHHALSGGTFTEMNLALQVPLAKGAAALSKAALPPAAVVLTVKVRSCAKR
jgi:hypothetical protein